MEKTSLVKTSNSEAYVIRDFHTLPIEWLETLAYDVEPELGYKHGHMRYQRRDVCFLCDITDKYTYSGYSAQAQPLEIHTIAVELLTKVNNALGTDFTGILINRYIDGTKYVGKHAENSRQLDENHPVAQLMLGVSRTFRISAWEKPLKDHEMQHGELLVMTGSFQRQFSNEIPKRTKITQPCYVLTLVSVIPKRRTC